MLIRSQDRMTIVNIDNIKKISIDECEDIIDAIKMFALDDDEMEEYEERYICAGDICLGKYSTEKAAIDVMDEICNTYQYQQSFGGAGAQYVYYMPEDREKE